MLRSILRLLSRPHHSPQPVDPKSPDQVILFAHLNRSARVPASVTPVQTTIPTSNHRARLLSMQLDHAKLCPPQRCEQFRRLGILTNGDLIAADLKTLATKFGASQKAIRVLKRYRHAIRLAANLPGMTPRDALLLISIHRRSLRGLAVESPMMLYRDLQRFSESTPGRRLLRGRRLPSLKRIRGWIEACESRIRASQSLELRLLPANLSKSGT